MSSSLLPLRPHLPHAFRIPNRTLPSSIRTNVTQPDNTARSTRTIPKKVLPRHAGPPPRKRPLPPAPSPSEAAALSAALTAAPSMPLRYHVSRTKSKQLPVYTELNSGGTRKITRIRKVEGNLSSLKEDLERVLVPIAESKGEKTEVKANWLTGHVIVKGLKAEEVKQFLAARNF